LACSHELNVDAAMETASSLRSGTWMPRQLSSQDNLSVLSSVSYIAAGAAVAAALLAFLSLAARAVKTYCAPARYSSSSEYGEDKCILGEESS